MDGKWGGPHGEQKERGYSRNLVEVGYGSTKGNVTRITATAMKEDIMSATIY